MITFRQRKNKRHSAARLYNQLSCLIIGATLIGYFFGCAQSISADPSPLNPLITLGTPQTGQSASDRPDSRFESSSPFSGRLIYAWDTGPIFFSGLGNEPPWQSYLTIHPIHPGRPEAVSTYPALIPKYAGIFQPQYSPDGTKILFKVGNYLTTNYVTYRPLILDLRTNKLTEIKAPTQSIGSLTVLWSQDSRYIAYLRHGVALPFGGEDTAQLYVYDTSTNTDQQIVENEGLEDNFAWTTKERLLYSIFPAGTPPTRPPADLYVFSAATGKSILLHHDAYRPVSSPDGQEIAFVSVIDPRLPVKGKTASKTFYHFTYEYAANKYLTLWSPVSGKVRLIRQEQAPQYSEIRWHSDSRGIIIINRHPISESQDQANITDYDLATNKQHKAATIIYADYEHIDDYRPLFLPLTVSKDNAWLFFSVRQPYMATSNDHGQFLRAVRLSDGTISTLCFIPGYNGLDWRQQ